MQDRDENRIHWLGVFSDVDTIPRFIDELSFGADVADLIDCLFIADEQGELLAYYAGHASYEPSDSNLYRLLALTDSPFFELSACARMNRAQVFTWSDRSDIRFKARVFTEVINGNICYIWAGVEKRFDRRTDPVLSDELMLHSFLDSANEGFILAGADFKILKINKALTSILNLGDAEFVGLPIFQVLNLKRSSECGDLLADVVRTGVPNTLSEEIFDLERGAVYISVTFFKVLEGVGIIVRDLTEMKNKEKELIKAKFEAEKSSKIKETFLTNISHELRTPLNAIVGMTEMLQQTETNPKQKKFIDVIGHSAESLKAIIDDMLDVTQIGAENFGLESKPFRIWEVVEIVQNFTYIKTSEKDINIEYKVNGIREDLYLLGDATRLAQVIKNLVSNAFKFTEKGTVRVSIKNMNETDHQITIHFEVLDTGIGISEEHKKKIFTLFSQRELGVTRQYGGVGLGLYLANRLINKSGGTLCLESELGYGSIFHFDLTFDKTSLPAEDAHLNFSGQNTLKNKRILLVEDQEFNQFLVTSNEKKWDCTIDVAQNGKIAIDMLKKDHYDVVLMDILMPVMGGEEATHYIRNQMPKPICDIPIIALTANALKGDREKYIQLGMNDYLPKPFKPSQLLVVLLRILNANSTISREQEDEMQRTELERTKKTSVCYDLGEIIALSNGNKDFIHKMLSIFVQSAYQSIDEVNQMTVEHQLRDIARAIHKIKSPVKLLKINELLDVIFEIESKIANSSSKDDLKPLINSYSILLANAANSISNELKAYV